VGLDEEPARRMSRVTPWTTGRDGLDVPQAGGVLDRRGVLVLGCSSQLLLLRLDVSDVGPVDSVAVRARTTPPRQLICPLRACPGRRRLLALCVPTSRDPNRLHPSSPAVGVRSVLVAVRNHRGPRALVDVRIRRVRRGGTAANGVRGKGAALVPPHARPALRLDTGVPARVGTITIICVVATRDDGPGQVTVPDLLVQA
jgi:hypothetical protein